MQQRWGGLILGMDQIFWRRDLFQARHSERRRGRHGPGAQGDEVWPEEEVLGVGGINDEELRSDWESGWIRPRTALVVLTVFEKVANTSCEPLL